MGDTSLVDLLDRWGKVVGFMAGVGALVASITNNPLVAYALAVAGWLLISLWLWRVWRQQALVRKALQIGTGTPERIYTDAQRRGAAVSLLLITIVIWGWVGRQSWYRIRPVSSPKVNEFSEGQFGIIVTEFTQGAHERAVYPGGADVRDKLYNDLYRLLVQKGLNDRIVVQQAGPVKDQKQAMAMGEKFKADLVVWGYVPINQPESFRPSFAILAENESLQTTNPVLFGVEITGRDTTEASTLLTKRVRAITGYIIGVVYLTEGIPGDYELAVSVLTDVIKEALGEYLDNEEMQNDLGYNLALFYWMRGRAYAALDEEDKALADYEQALSYWPGFERAYVGIGNLYYVRMEFSKAKDYYEHAKRYWYGNYGLGLIAYHQAQHDEAIECLIRALDQAQSAGVPLDGQTTMKIRFVLGMAYKQRGEWENAEPILVEVCNAEYLPSEFRYGVCVELTPKISETMPTEPLGTPLPTITTHLPPTAPQPSPPQPTLAPTPMPTLLPTGPPPPTLRPTPAPPTPTPMPTLLPTGTPPP